MKSKTKKAIVRIEHDERPHIQQPWIAILISPSGMATRRRHLSRNGAINAAASYLCIHDERRQQAAEAFLKIRTQIVEEYERMLDREAPPE